MTLYGFVEKHRLLYDKYGSQGFLDCIDVGIDIDRIDLTRSNAAVKSTLNGFVKDTVAMKDARGTCGTPYKQLNDPYEVFYETFGYREPPLNGFVKPKGWSFEVYSRTILALFVSIYPIALPWFIKFHPRFGGSGIMAPYQHHRFKVTTVFAQIGHLH